MREQAGAALRRLDAELAGEVPAAAGQVVTDEPG
jgi:hypothetical protein